MEPIQPTPADRLRLAEDRIDWVLANPDASGWLKAALREARAHDPVVVMNDLEMLRLLLHARSEAIVDQQILATPGGPLSRSGAT